MAMISDGADDIGLDQGYAVALINLAWSSGQTVGAAGGARLGETYGDALPYLTLAAVCALTLAAVSRPRYAGGAGRELITSTSSGHSSRGSVAWPKPSTSTSRAPGMAAASARPCSTGNIGSAVPCTTTVGTRISPRRSRASGPPSPSNGYV